MREARVDDDERVDTGGGQRLGLAALVLAPVPAVELHVCFARGNKVLVCGNGGSASDSEHFVAELVGRYKDDRRALPALALSAGGTATLTAVANDYGYDTVFARQVEALARPGDLLFAISTSGNSPNVLKGAEAARECGMTTVAWTGANGGKLAGLVDYPFIVPSTVTSRIQESHMRSRRCRICRPGS